MYEFFWQLANRVRHYFGKQCQVRRCCKDTRNTDFAQVRPDLVVGRCRVCGSRHFGLTVDPGVIGIHGAPMGG